MDRKGVILTNHKITQFVLAGESSKEGEEILYPLILKFDDRVIGK